MMKTTKATTSSTFKQKATSGPLQQPAPSKASGSRTTVTHGKDAKLVQTVHQAEQVNRHRDPFKALDPATLGRKAVFRPVLASPFTVDWPSVSAADAGALLHTLLSLLQLPPLQEAFVRRKEEMPRSSAAKTKLKNQRRKTRLLLAALRQHGIDPVLAQPAARTDGMQNGRKHAAAILCGLNSVTRTLEQRISHHIRGTPPFPTIEEADGHRSSLVVVCHSDLSPPALVSHIPLLVATYNAMCAKSTALLRLPSGSELLLADAMKLRRCSVLSIDYAAITRIDSGALQTRLKELQNKLKQADVQAMRMSWLDQAASAVATAEAGIGKTSSAPPYVNLLPPRIKHMRSSAPISMATVKAAVRVKRQRRKETRKSRGVKAPQT